LFSKRTPDHFPAESNVHSEFQGSANEQIDQRNSYVNEEAIENIHLDNNGYCILEPVAVESQSYDMLDVS
jgi:hypothetical protein